MKYIKLYESRSEIANYFKDKIDWKFYNYISDRLVEYEDMGYVFVFTVDYKWLDIDRYNWLYERRDGVDEYVNSDVDFIVKNYKKHGLFYTMWIYDLECADEEKGNHEEIVEKVFTRIQAKAEKVFFEDGMLIVKPK